MKKQISHVLLWLYNLLNDNKTIPLAVASDGTPNGTYLLADTLKVGRVQSCGIKGFEDFVTVRLVLHADKVDVFGSYGGRAYRLNNEGSPFNPRFKYFKCFNTTTGETVKTKYFRWSIGVGENARLALEVENENLRSNRPHWRI